MQMQMPLVLKIKKDNKQLETFTKQLNKIAVDELMESNISEYQFSKIIDLITCMDLKTKEMSFEIASYLNDKKRKKKFTHNIDIRA